MPRRSPASHHRHRHDVYDDTAHNQDQFDPANEVTIHRRDSDRSSRHHHSHQHPNHYPNDHSHHHQNNALVADPFRDMDSMWPAAERDMDYGFGSGFGGFGGGMFGSMRNMMASVDRMFDDITANAGSGSGGTYYYESRKMTVGPDGRVHEETVRTVPDAHGNPQTSRTIRDGDRVEELPPSRGRLHAGPSSGHQNDDVIIEEVDENGDPIHEERPTRRISRDQRAPPHDGRRASRDERNRYRRDDRYRRRDEREHTAGGWLRNKYREWRSGA